MEEKNTTPQPGLFEKGGKLWFLHSTIDAFDTFLRVPGTVTRTGAHVRDAVDLKRIMIIVVLALVPAALFGMWNVGYQHSLATGVESGLFANFWYGLLKVLPLYIVAYLVGLGIEFASAQIRNEEVNEGYLVSGMLIPLIVPVDVPLWMLAIAVAFAVLFGKEVFGGTGMNFLNPALLCRAFLFFSYPSKMSGSEVWISLRNGESLVDGVTGATPLAYANEGLAAVNNAGFSAWDLFAGTVPGSVGETSVIAILIGAVILIWTGVASWKIMISSVGGALLVGWLGNVCGATDIPAWYQLIMGGFAFGTVFMATDPVTSAQTECGKWIYGFLVGALCVVVRLFNPGYAEGMMLAILLMNTFAPLIDHYVTSAAISRRMKRVRTA
ncbi:MAG: NADH:ubiquinone reductase (Na(+)-transporting) subunit B [Candidatus Cryptobacteroides sp.]|nr:NADH:ubiquinone reductase (Na(+)-transporting) subunit B [Bacteroidales bacterium]MDY3226313.1 NADH:ubiquinone reductase (Na(+)-transporting) subunit B [Candidatus Cryptobacteroides sp.]MCI7635699.1 NADH:ubiquinone reductase (Na(+)-transporting) subunit B [Bacteroidales bacterium]MDD7084006.1 NADH:ubiquinone reductase (Na(+)-transporting) subunit B [Bacteroidales bacterium]MDD7154185.1 NADH:ubiquinone reductase (Na(+)-transporting) subunit B [Bacteroidales bacterium]